MIEITHKLPPMAEECKTPVSAQEVVRWPETLALLNRLGIKLDRPYRRLILDLDFIEGDCTVHLEQRGSDTEPKPDKVETTSQHNEKWRTYLSSLIANLPDDVTPDQVYHKEAP